ncbi:MAG TPA: C39 family peptidase [bacterium]|nr:C39 family peptidase [bacterium]HPN67423.1 C39 family peptidase [bacterium]
MSKKRRIALSRIQSIHQTSKKKKEPASKSIEHTSLSSTPSSPNQSIPSATAPSSSTTVSNQKSSPTSSSAVSPSAISPSTTSPTPNQTSPTQKSTTSANPSNKKDDQSSSPSSNTTDPKNPPDNSKNQSIDSADDQKKNQQPAQSTPSSPAPGSPQSTHSAPSSSPATHTKPHHQDLEKKGTPSVNHNLPQTPGNKSGGPIDKVKAARDPKEFAKNQAKQYAKKVATKAATSAATKALGSTIGTAIGGPVGTLAGLAAGFLIDYGIEVSEKVIRWLLIIIDIFVIFFVTLIVLILIAIGSFFFSGGGGHSTFRESGIEGQVTPVASPTDLPAGVMTLDKPSTWSQKQATSTGCHCTSIAMYLTFLGKPATESDICNLAGDNVSFSAIENSYHVTRAGQLIDTDSFSEYQTFIKDAINKGKPIILGVSQPIAKGNGHFIVVVGYDDKYIYVNDPNANNPGQQTWDTLQSANYSKTNGGLAYHGYTISLSQ